MEMEILNILQKPKGANQFVEAIKNIGLDVKVANKKLAELLDRGFVAYEKDCYVITEKGKSFLAQQETPIEIDDTKFKEFLQDLEKTWLEGHDVDMVLAEKWGEEFLNHPELLYRMLISILKDWMDMDEHYYPVIATWLIGTLAKDTFNTFPYLFINASKRSGKSRLLRLCKFLVENGVYTASLTEAVLFRLPARKDVCLFIDEAEYLGRKGKEALRELLNAAYKKGVKILRMRKIPKKEIFITDEFDVFVPVAIANIAGIDDILADRCITIILERSFKREIVNKPELFEFDPKINFITKRMKIVQLVQFLKQIDNMYNLFCKCLLNPKFIYTIYTNYTNFTKYTKYTNYTKYIELINKAQVIGRDLELWLPLLTVALTINPAYYKQLLTIAERLSQERAVEDVIEDRDTMVLGFIAGWLQKQLDLDAFFLLRNIAREFREQEDAAWMNSRVLSRCLKRLRVVVERRRMSTGVEVRLNHKKIMREVKRRGIQIEVKLTPREEELEQGIQGYLPTGKPVPPVDEYED